MIAIVVFIQGDLRNLMTWEIYSKFLEGHFFLLPRLIIQRLIRIQDENISSLSNQVARRVPKLNNS